MSHISSHKTKVLYSVYFGLIPIHIVMEHEIEYINTTTFLYTFTFKMLTKQMEHTIPFLSEVVVRYFQNCLIYLDNQHLTFEHTPTILF